MSHHHGAGKNKPWRAAPCRPQKEFRILMILITLVSLALYAVVKIYVP